MKSRTYVRTLSRNIMWPVVVVRFFPFYLFFKISERENDRK